jgi:hypothetical protein
MNTYPLFHASKLKPHILNDHILFPEHQFSQPRPILVLDGLEDHTIDKIIDLCHHGRGWQFLMCWSSYGLHHDEWLPAADLQDCEALNLWYQIGGDRPNN